ncbi:MAG: SWIM zinc finger family protein [Cyanobacteria bacterium]|nr:SWIM zinc finger family protein [Cyanobacteriota bacterium]
MSSVNLAYRYAFPSILEAGDRPNLRLATSGGIEQYPYFFSGRLLFPRRTCDMLLALSHVSRTRFYSPKVIRERMLSSADPVVTSGGERLRFEAFSVCCGVYARLDLRPEAIDGEWTGRGTTNVDFNLPMRTALTGVLDSEGVGLKVGEDRLVIERGDQPFVEKKVKLPVRWLKGFVEVQAYQARMKPMFEVSASELRQVLKTVPAQQVWKKGTLAYLVPAGKGIRLSQREAPRCVAVGAPGRLKILEDLLRHAKSVRIYSGDDGVTAWELCLPEGNLHLVLSPDASRGFSGEGQVLEQLVRAPGVDKVSQVRSMLTWQAKVDPAVIARELELEHDIISGALGLLGTRGLVGFDLAEGAYFHRELPFALELIEELQPRMQKARKLAEAKGVRLTKQSGNHVEAYVKGSECEHRVIITDGDGKCTCPWYSKHPGERGPCSHILAVDLVSQRSEE